MEQTCVRFDDTDQWLVMTRGSVLLACNFAGASQRIPCRDLAAKEIVFCSEEGVMVEDKAVLLPGQAVVILDDCENGRRFTD
jgi:hypothetical protein